MSAMTNHEKDKSKNTEPFKADETPNPPQQMNPGRGEREDPRASRNASEEKSDRQPAKQPNKEPNDNKPEEKLLGESDTEITDETTI